MPYLDKSSGKPSSAKKYFWLVFRWLAFLPLAYLAGWLATLLMLSIRSFQEANGLFVMTFATQVANGAAIGWVGVKVAPRAKIFALACCALLSALISLAYFLKFPDLFGGLAAATGFLATLASGVAALDDH